MPTEAADTSLAAPGHRTSAKHEAGDDRAWRVLGPALTKFHEGGSRKEFLATCKKILGEHPGSRYDEELKSLIAPLEREATAPRPAFLQRAPMGRTEEEQIRCCVWQLRDLAAKQHSSPGYPLLFSYNSVRPTTADQLVAFGLPAIPYLIEALDDDTPTRTLAFQRSFYPIRFVLRRQDVALKCLERIAGCEFYDEASPSMHLYRDTPVRRLSVLANVRAWWAVSQGKPQAEMIRNQLTLREKNLTLRNWDKVFALETLAMLEGPAAVVGDAARLLAGDRYGLNSPVTEFVNHISPRMVVQAIFTRFRENQSRDGDYPILFKYGDRKVYEEIARRFEATRKLDPGAWVVGDQIRMAARYGKNWAIPLAAKGMEIGEGIGSRYVAGATRSFSSADVAAEVFQELTGKDFGHRARDSQESREAAIQKATAWWAAEGRKELATRVAADHPPVVDPGDLFLSDDEIGLRVSAIQDSDREKRAKTVASLGEVYSWEIQQALLGSIERENEAKQRLRMLQVVAQRPALWQFPWLVRWFEHDPDLETRKLAGECLRKVVADRTTRMSWLRLETRDCGLAAARRVARDAKAPSSVRHAAVDILTAWGSFVDQPLLHGLAAEPAMRDYKPLVDYLERQEALLKLPVPATPQE